MNLTLIVPIYNAAPFLPRSLGSIADQPDMRFIEVIVLDDGSTDGSAEIAKEYAKRYGWRFVQFKYNQGVSAMRNLGIDMARGKYITFLDADDALSTNALEYIKAAIVANPDEKIIQFAHNRHIDDGPAAKPFITGHYKLGSVEKLPNHWWFVWNKVYKAEAIKDHRFKPIQYGEDELFNFELLLQGVGIFQSGLTTVEKYFNNANSLAHRKTMTELIAQDEAIKALKSVYKLPSQQWNIDELLESHHNSAIYQSMGWKNQ